MVVLLKWNPSTQHGKCWTIRSCANTKTRQAKSPQLMMRLTRLGPERSTLPWLVGSADKISDCVRPTPGGKNTYIYRRVQRFLLLSSFLLFTDLCPAIPSHSGGEGRWLKQLGDKGAILPTMMSISNRQVPERPNSGEPRSL